MMVLQPYMYLCLILIENVCVFTEYLFRLSDAIVNSFNIVTYEDGNVKLLKAITSPFTKYIIKVTMINL